MTSEEKVNYYADLTAECLVDEYYIAERPAFCSAECVEIDNLAEFLKPFLKQLLEEQ